MRRASFLVQTVDFLNIVSEEVSEGVDFGAELCYFGGALVLLVCQLLLQLLYLEAGGLVLVVKLALNGVVFDVLARVLELCELVVEVLILALEVGLSTVEFELFEACVCGGSPLVCLYGGEYKPSGQQGESHGSRDDYHITLVGSFVG